MPDTCDQAGRGRSRRTGTESDAAARTGAARGPVRILDGPEPSGTGRSPWLCPAILVIETGKRANNVARVGAHAEFRDPANVDGNLHLDRFYRVMAWQNIRTVGFSAAGRAGDPQATGFSSTPMPSMEMRTRSPCWSVKSSPGTIPVPVIR